MRLTSVHGPLFPDTHRSHSVMLGVWRLADPKIGLASLVPFVVGTALAFDQLRSIDWGLALAAYAAVFLVEVGKNAVNDIYDFRSGADQAVRPDERSPFSGGKRTLVDALLTEHDLFVVAWIAFGLAGVIGLDVARRSSAQLLLLGLAAAIVSIIYVMPPFKLAYRSLGEAAVGLVYGPGIVFGSLLLQGGTIHREAVVAAATFGILIALVLLVNEFPDERADRNAGKRTLVVRLGRDRSESLVALFFSVAFAIPTILIAYGLIPFRMSWILIALPVAIAAYQQIQTTKHGPPVLGQALTLITYVVAGVATASAVLLLPA
jgi:1,4-dihydroxy-2-naphthoate polyprenyltransferase